MIRVAVYARTSNAGTDPGLQLEAAREYASSRGWSIEAEYVDRGVFGVTALADRPSGRVLMEAAMDGRIDTILCYKRDRLFRWLGDALVIESLLREHGVGLAFTHDPPVRDDEVEWLAQMVEAFRTETRRTS